jgi:hypothetical protein
LRREEEEEATNVMCDEMQLSRWRTQLGLGPAIGATFFTIDTGINGGQGGNSSGPLPTGGAPAGVSPSAYGAGLSAIVAIFGLMMLV